MKLLIWTQEDEISLSYFRLISRHLTPELRQQKDKLEAKFIDVVGSRFPGTVAERRAAEGAQDDYSLWYKTEQENEEEVRMSATTAGRKGGLSTSPAKVSASRENGKKGGRKPKDKEGLASRLQSRLDG